MGRSANIFTERRDFFRLFGHNFPTVIEFISLPKEPFFLTCENRSHTLFSIYYLNTMQILGAETVIPIFLFFTTCAFGFLTFVTRPLTRRPLSFLVERIDSSGRRVSSLLVGAISMMLVLLVALAKYGKE
jgi:hypothetical protein